MAPIKFEEHVKAQLEKREISPSSGSWEKLQGRLGKSERVSRRKLWLTGAAAVVVILISGSLFLNLQKQNTENPIVDTQSKTPKTTEEDQASKEIQIVSAENEVEDEKEISSNSKKDNSTMASSKQIRNSVSKENEKGESVAVMESKREILEPISLEPEYFVEEKEDLLSKELNELIASVALEGEELTDEEVNALLMDAAREITSQNNIRKGFNADDLLADVESEIDQSFRREVFEFLKEEFVKARTAFASRND